MCVTLYGLKQNRTFDAVYGASDGPGKIVARNRRRVRDGFVAVGRLNAYASVCAAGRPGDDLKFFSVLVPSGLLWGCGISVSVSPFRLRIADRVDGHRIGGHCRGAAKRSSSAVPL
jgi:hypothetical protein